ncbi:MAG: 1-phosphofructokinase [Metamycoplasmataceae bacterium]
MFYTITFSPSIDFFIESNNQFDRNGLTRYESSFLLAGGKGINASIMLKRLGFDTKAIGFAHGSISNLITDQLQDEGIEFIKIPSENETRINVQFNNQINNFQLNGPSSIVSEESKNKLMKLISKLNKNDVVFIMGRSDMILVEEIIKELNKKSIKFILDIDSKEVIKLLKYKPFAMKPNSYELETLMGTKIKTEKDIIKAGQKLLDYGLQNLLISFGEEGSYLINKTKTFKIEVPRIKAINATGAGDSMLSAFTANYITTNNLEESFIIGNAAGMATAASPWLGTLEKVNEFKKLLKIKEIKK